MLLSENSKLSLRHATGYYTARLLGKDTNQSIEMARERMMMEMRRMIGRSTDNLVKKICA